ncbi:hypothetical protein B0T14DRAFT_570807 [Immersiella caudata]|uniref:Uncharacterized protein n=1 Tax=Immersiella caudata TaxID=314043 RepID=A0AA39TS45_9PEZI|nr:hypothetical protein B0T14DRAFT_570807 [Immersiella caudata]
MDWDSGQADFTEHDTSNFSFYFDQECLVVRKRGNDDDEPPSIRKITGKVEWDAWFEDEREVTDDTTQPCFYAMHSLQSRTRGLPRSAFTDLALALWKKHMESTSSNTAGRQKHYAGDSQKRSTLFLAYSARMSTSLPADLALSTTFIPSMQHSYSIVYGCNPTQMRGTERRLRSAGRYMSHPLLLAGIFAELERERLIAEVDGLVDKFAASSSIPEDAKWDPNSTQIRDYFTNCIKSRNLVDQIKAVKRQLVSFLEELAVLDAQWQEELETLPPKAPFDDEKRQPNDTRQRLHNALETGQRIKRRLSDISVEYDEKIDECEMIAQNLPLAMQTVWNQTSRQEFIINTRIAKANNTIALETKRESTQMRSIALLTMVYLPMSCVASIFSTSLFNFSPSEGESVVSRYIWVLVGLSLGLTAITMAIWHVTTNRESKREAERKDIQLDDMV